MKMGSNRKRPEKATPKPENPGIAARLSPLEYEVAVWVGRGARPREIADRLGLDVGEVALLVLSAAHYSGCRNIAELEAMFEPDWARLDDPPQSRWEKVGGRQVLRGGEMSRRRARQAYAEKKDRDLIEAMKRFGM
jgi:DNA-binding CsgD family transcriptional regulator